MKSLIFGKVSEDEFHSDIVDAMVPGEEILLRVEQPRLLKSLFNPANIYVTSSRIMRRDSSWFGLFSFCIEYPLTEILSCNVARNLMFGSFYATLRFSKDIIAIEKIPKKGATLIQQKVRNPFVSGKIEEVTYVDSNMSEQKEALKQAIKQVVTV